MKLLSKPLFYAAVGAAGLILDQITKFWAASHPMDPGWIMPIIGDGDGLLNFIHRRNLGAAFSMNPQNIAPWLSPTVFFGTLTVIAIAGAIYFFRKLPEEDCLGRLGITLIIAGALGNFCGRLLCQGEVVDFIDVDFPDIIFKRWPTFNLADSWVTIGIALLFISSIVFKKKAGD